MNCPCCRHSFYLFHYTNFYAINLLLITLIKEFLWVIKNWQCHTQTDEKIKEGKQEIIVDFINLEVTKIFEWNKLTSLKRMYLE